MVLPFVAKLAGKVISEFKENGEAAPKYQDVQLQLTMLERVLSRLYDLRPGRRHLEHLDAIRAAATACKRPLENFLEKTSKFDKTLGTWDAKEKKFKGVGRRIQYNLVFNKEVKELRFVLQGHISNIQTLLMAQTLMSITSAESDRVENARRHERHDSTHSVGVSNVDGHLIATGMHLDSHTTLLHSPIEHQIRLRENEDPLSGPKPCCNEAIIGTSLTTSETKQESQCDDQDAGSPDSGGVGQGEDPNVKTWLTEEVKGNISAQPDNDNTNIDSISTKHEKLTGDKDEADADSCKGKIRRDEEQTVIRDAKAEWSDAEKEQVILDEMQADINNLRRQGVGGLLPRAIHGPAPSSALDIISRMLTLVFSLHTISSTMKLARQAHEMSCISESIAIRTRSNEWPTSQPLGMKKLIGDSKDVPGSKKQHGRIGRGTPKKLSGLDRGRSELWDDESDQLRNPLNHESYPQDDSRGPLAHENSQQGSRYQVPPAKLSFLFSIENLCDNRPRSMRTKEWYPPRQRDQYLSGKFCNLFCWRKGEVSQCGDNDYRYDLTPFHYRSSTVFHRSGGESHFLAVDFDARTRDVSLSPGNWEALGFDLVQNKGDVFSYLRVTPCQGRLLAPSSKSWMPQLLPPEYGFDPTAKESPHSRAKWAPAGLVGSLPLLLALAAFSAQAKLMDTTLCDSIRPGAWRPHKSPTGHTPKRGMVVKVFQDPMNPNGSSRTVLNDLQNGEYGAFYGV